MKEEKTKKEDAEGMGRGRMIVAIALVVLFVSIFVVAMQTPKDAVKEIGLSIPLPVFTVLIAILDGFNPCTMWVLSFLLVLLISVSHSKKRILVVGYTFVTVVFLIYFLFMATWLNIFMYLGYIDILRIIIGSVALIAGLINCKEYFFFRKGVTLMIQDKHKKPLVNKIESMKDKIKTGSMPALIGASVVLAAFASLVELPCTAGWPLIYTTILAEKVFEDSMVYYGYLLLYNLIYVIPLAVIITVFGCFLKGKQVTKEQMQIIKLIGGVFMVALGIVLLVNPELLMLM